MTPAIQTELNRLREILATVEIELNPTQGASLEAIAKAEHELGIRFDKHLREFWQFTNGSNYQDWFAVRWAVSRYS